VSRCTRFTPGTMSADQRDLYDRIVSGPRASGPQLFDLVDQDGALCGPFNAFLLNPELGEALQRVGAALRYRSTLPPRLREMAILAVAAAWESEFEWYAHERVGRSVGITDAELAALQAGFVPELADASERLGIEVTRALLAGDVDDDLYAAARSGLGEECLFELTTVVGYYATLALQLRVFRVSP
jgi:4-carboxymuconolactone decarboxylase